MYMFQDTRGWWKLDEKQLDEVKKELLLFDVDNSIIHIIRLSPFKKTMIKILNDFAPKVVDEFILKMFNRDSWFEGRILNLYRNPYTLNYLTKKYTWIRVRMGDHVIDRKYMFKNIYIFEMMTIDKLARDKKAREYFIEEFTSFLLKGSVYVDGKHIPLGEYAKLKGIDKQQIESRIREKVNTFFEFYKKKMDEYDKKGDMSNKMSIEGDKLGYYLFIKEEMMKDDVWFKLATQVSDIIAHNTALIIISRSSVSSVEPKFVKFSKGITLSEESLIASFLGIDPEKELEKAQKISEWEALNIFKGLVKKEIEKSTRHIMKKDKVMSKFKLDVPVLSVDSIIETTEQKNKERSEIQKEKRVAVAS